MCPHIHIQPVDEPAFLRGYRYVSCIPCALDWPLAENPACCPECFEPVQPGRSKTALQRAYRENGL